MSACARCSGESDGAAATWCKPCEAQYDGWSRRHASDIVWQALVGGLIVTGVGMGLPLLGIGTLVAAAGAFAGFGALYGLARVTRRRRRRQFLRSALPRAYLPAPK